MDIAAMASVMKHSQIKQQVNISLAKMSMDVSKDITSEMIKMMEHSVTPHLGNSIDLKL